MSTDYTQPDHIKFVKDARRKKLKVFHYRGRFFWEGPAVEVSDLQTGLSISKVKLQWDHLGHHYVVYPVQNK